MNLPELALQIGYGRVGWAIVLAAAIIHATPAARRWTRYRVWAVLLAASAAVALPGQASYAYWLGLACQYPSGLLVGCCVASLWTRMRGERLVYRMPARLAIVIAPAGALLYLDAIGWLAQGFYFWGFSQLAVPALALAATGACVLSIARDGLRPSALALTIALSLFTLLRLPSGNLWDALLDPLLWAWACAAVIGMLRQRQSDSKTKEYLRVT
jgi:hypothetical protein